MAPDNAFFAQVPGNYLMGGTLQVNIGTGNWSFGNDTRIVIGGLPQQPVGSGSFTVGANWNGVWSSTNSGGSQTWSFPSYSSANALSVSLADLAGLWGGGTPMEGPLSLLIDASGGVSGTTLNGSTGFGSCTVTGTLSLYTPGSQRNLFKIELTPAGGSGCHLTAAKHTGLAAIGFVNTGTVQAPVWKRNLQFIVGRPNGQGFFNGYPVKQ